MICPICSGEWVFHKVLKRPICKECLYVDPRSGSWENYGSWRSLSELVYFNEVCLIILSNGKLLEDRKGMKVVEYITRGKRK